MANHDFTSNPTSEQHPFITRAEQCDSVEAFCALLIDIHASNEINDMSAADFEALQDRAESIFEAARVVAKLALLGGAE